MAASGAFAQGPDKPDDQSVPQAPLEEVVVSGYRQSIDASLDAKREADATVDVITAQDVGKFPDKNVADALQRVPGVIISRDGGREAAIHLRDPGPQRQPAEYVGLLGRRSLYAVLADYPAKHP
jgi:outer membrane cobalamin receptor